MRILYLNYMNDLYGSSIGSTIKAKKLLQGLRDRGHEVVEYWPFDRPGTETGSTTVERGTRKRSRRLRRWLFTPKQVLWNAVTFCKEIRLLRRVRPDLVIVRLDLYRVSAVLAARWYRLPVILEADGAMSYEWLRYNNPDGVLWKSWVLNLEYLNLHYSTHIIAQSQVTRNYYRRLHKVSSSSLSVITNGTDIPVCKKREQRRRELSIPSDAIVCGFLGSLHYWHGIDSFLSLFQSVLPRFPQVYFLFLGSGGPLTQKIQDSIQNDLSRRIVFVPYIEHDMIADYVDLFDVALAPYPKTKVFYYSPVKIFEYMALGKAILTVPLGQIRRVLSDGQSALFYRYDDPSDLEKKFVTLIEHPEQRAALGHEAARLIREYHTWAHKAEALEIICQTVTGIQ